MDVAEARLDSLLIDSPSDKQLLNLRSCIRSALGKHKEAASDANLLLALDRKWYKGVARAAACEYNTGNKMKAISLYEEAVVLNPDSSLVKKEISRLKEEVIQDKRKRRVTFSIPDPAKDVRSSSSLWEEPSCKAWRDAILSKCERFADEGFTEKVASTRDLLRSYVEYSVMAASSTPLKKRDGVKTIRTVLRLVYDLSTRLDDHPKIPSAMASIFDTFKSKSEAYSIRHQYGVPNSADDLPQHNTLDLCFFPSRVVYKEGAVEEEKAVSSSPWTFRPRRRLIESGIEYVNIAPHMAIYVEHSCLKDSVGVLVFRFPSKFISRVETSLWAGLSESSCCFIVSGPSDFDNLVFAAENVCHKSGGVVVVVYPKEQHYSGAVKKAKELGVPCISVEKNTSLHLYRNGLFWTIRHTKG